MLGRRTFDAYLSRDDASFVRKYYPEDLDCDTSNLPPRDLCTITISEAAKLMNLTRAGAYKKIVERGDFKTLRRVGPPNKPIYLLDIKEVKTFVERGG